MCDYQKAYYKEIMPKVRAGIAALKAEIGKDGTNHRVSYLEGKLKLTESEIQQIHARYEELTTTDSPYINKYIVTLSLETLEKDLKKIRSELNYLNNSLNGKLNCDSITPDMIEIARQYPIESLIEVNRNKALCPFHDDHNPSMGIKNNRYHCFSCGEKGDVIDFVMKKDNFNFIGAVKTLTN